MSKKAVTSIILTLLLISFSDVVLFAELATANPDLEHDSRPGVSIIRLTFNPDSWDVQPNIAGDGPKAAFMSVPGENATNNNYMYSLVTVRRTAVVFEIVAYYPGESVYAVWLGDLNGDGVVDLAVTNNGPGLVTVMLGLGDCTFSSGLNYSVGRYPRSICGADLDGDGDVDLATANQLSHTVSVLLNKGDATFESAVEFPAGTEAIDICCADFDGDGDADLATANYGSPTTFSVLMNNGNATFAEPVEYETGGRWPTSIVARDFDRDGDVDIAVGNQFGPFQVSVLLNYGNGTFGNIRNYGGANVWDINPEDFDGDGDFDLAVANSWGGRGVSIFLNRGDATFTWHGEYSVERNPNAVFAGDFDSNGDMDLAVTTDSYLSILVNEGDGTFSEDSRYDEGRYLQSVCGADLDNDSDVDLVTTSWSTDTITVLRNELPPPPPEHYLIIGTTAGGTTDPLPGTYSYTENSTVEVTAIPEAGYLFDYWELDGVNVGSTNPYPVLMDKNHTLKAFFAVIPPPLSVSISPATAEIKIGESVTFTSSVSGGTPQYSYQWYLNGSAVSGATSDTWTFTPTESGIFYVYLKVTDDEGNTAQSETARITASAVPVGGYSIPINVSMTTTKPVTSYIALLTILTAILITIKRKTKKKAKM